MPTPYDATRCDARITLMLTPTPSNPRRSLAGLNRQPFLLAAFVLFWFHMAHAETVTIANMDVSREAILREAALKQFLREDGYTVKGASPEGFIVLLHGMRAQTRQDASVGVVGSATVVKMLRRESTAALLPEGYPQAQESPGTFNAAMVASDLPCWHHSERRGCRGSAQVLSIYVNTVLQHSPFRASELLQVPRKSATEHESTRSPETGR